MCQAGQSTFDYLHPLPPYRRFPFFTVRMECTQKTCFQLMCPTMFLPTVVVQPVFTSEGLENPHWRYGPELQTDRRYVCVGQHLRNSELQ